MDLGEFGIPIGQYKLWCQNKGQQISSTGGLYLVETHFDGFKCVKYGMSTHLRRRLPEHGDKGDELRVLAILSIPDSGTATHGGVKYSGLLWGIEKTVPCAPAEKLPGICQRVQRDSSERERH